MKLHSELGDEAPAALTPEIELLGNYCIGGWAGPRESRCDEDKNDCLCWNLNPGLPTRTQPPHCQRHSGSLKYDIAKKMAAKVQKERYLRSSENFGLIFLRYYLQKEY
jgi:hypothetical protein